MSFGPENMSVFINHVHIELQTTFAEGTVNYVHRQGFLEVFLSACSDFHFRIMPAFNVVLPVGMKITDI